MRVFPSLALVLLWTTVVAALPRWSVAQSNVVHDTTITTCNNDDDNNNQEPRAVLQAFLAHHRPDTTKFKIQGWRWHTMSLIREAGRVAVALQQQPSSKALETAVDYVVNFNLRGLDRIQSTVFFPWVRQEIKARAEPSIVTAFAAVMDELESQAAQAVRLGKELQSAVTKQAPSAGQTATALVDTATSMLQIEESLLIPLVAHYIPTSTQSWLNQRVLRTLGVWDSRLHLVAMHQAIHTNATEYRRFQQEIPYLARSMIGRWKRHLYDPKVAALE